MAMLGGGAKGAMVDEKDALPGRQQEMRVENKHFVLGNPIKEPFPDNLETCVFATGCFLARRGRGEGRGRGKSFTQHRFTHLPRS